MVFGGSWLFMVVHDGFDVSWWFLGALGGYYRLWLVIGASWCFLVVLGGSFFAFCSWWFLVVLGVFRWFLVGLGGCW